MSDGPTAPRPDAPRSPRPHTPTRPGPRFLWALLVLAAAAGVGVIAFPTFYIMPFRTQDAAVLEWAFRARTAAPVATLAAAIATAVLALLTALRTRRWWLRPLPLLLVAPVVAGAWLARQNHFEWMFAPQTVVEHVTPEKATFVEPDDLVMSVVREGAAVAYPIRQLAYHHIANDVLAGEPIVATY